MSNTRRAEAGSPFRQERFSSSPEFERGLLANLVARRCELIADDAHRNLAWWLQLVSWNEGLEKLAQDLISAFPERVATKAMQSLGMERGKIYGSEIVRRVRREINDTDYLPHPSFPLRGEIPNLILDPFVFCEGEQNRRDRERREQKEALAFPESYSGDVFFDWCHRQAQGLPALLAELCLNPEMEIGKVAPVYFPKLISSLAEYQAAWIKVRRAGQVVTELGSLVWDTLDYCLQTRRMVLLDGLARTGKTFSVKAWCDLHPGEVRYVQVPSGDDDRGFFKAIAKSLGMATSESFKAQQLRDRIEDVLQRGKLAVVFDEAHYCFPQGYVREKTPGRINWIMTALANQGVPVALVTTPQFMRAQNEIERKSLWTGAQLTGRIMHYQKLPDTLSEKDLCAVAKYILPEGCPRSIEILSVYAQSSSKYLAAIEAITLRARYIAGKSKRDKVAFTDVKAAIEESVIPSDRALAVALAQPKKATRSRAIAAPANMPTLEFPQRNKQPEAALEMPEPAPRQSISPAHTLKD